MPKGRAPHIVLVFVTCPTAGAARRIAAALVKRRLAACVNLLPGVESTFRWRGKIERAREVLLLLKTTQSHVEQLRRAVVRLHPYDVPEVIACRVHSGHPPYLRWVAQSVRASRSTIR